MEYAKPELVVVGQAASIVLGSEQGGTDTGSTNENRVPMGFGAIGLDD